MKNKLFYSTFIFILSSAFNLYGQGCAPKMVLMEQSCAKLCAPCLAKIESRKVFYAEHKDEIAFVVYNQAPIGLGTWGDETEPYDGFHSEFDIGYQSSLLVDRTLIPDNMSEFEAGSNECIADDEAAFEHQINMEYVPVEINISRTYNDITREVVVDIEGAFCDTASGDLRFYLVLVQDFVVGPEGYDYAQAVLSESQAESYGYEYSIADGLPVIESYPHPQVVKYQPSGFFGNEGVIATTVEAGDTFSESYTFTLPEFGSPESIVPLEPNSVEIIAAVVRNGEFMSRQVLNVNKIDLTDETNSIPDEIINNVGFSVIQNPISNGELNLDLEVDTETNGSIVIFNARGEEIKVISTNQIYPSGYTNIINYDVSGLSKGIYFVAFRGESKQYTQKFIID